MSEMLTGRKCDMTEDEQLSHELSTLKQALLHIARMRTEDNEWHAVELYGEARETAIEALKVVGVTL